jgi:hypothetical protein
MEQTNLSGFTAQTWDIGANEANFFVRDLSGGSRLPFRIRPGAGSSALDIASNSWVGFGTASPNFPLDAVKTGVGGPMQRLANDGPSSLRFENTGERRRRRCRERAHQAAHAPDDEVGADGRRDPGSEQAGHADHAARHLQEAKKK